MIVEIKEEIKEEILEEDPDLLPRAPEALRVQDLPLDLPPSPHLVKILRGKIFIEVNLLVLKNDIICL
jgi:hypothetical protein